MEDAYHLLGLNRSLLSLAILGTSLNSHTSLLFTGWKSELFAIVLNLQRNAGIPHLMITRYGNTILKNFISAENVITISTGVKQKKEFQSDSDDDIPIGGCGGIGRRARFRI